MNSESIDQPAESSTDESENAYDEAPEIIFTPEDDDEPEPPISFNPIDEQSLELTFDSPPPPELDAPVAFELLGTSLFENGDFEDDLISMDPIDFDDDLEL
jgi:hypothetical protein